MAGRLASKVALVTAAAAGIGRATAEAQLRARARASSRRTLTSLERAGLGGRQAQARRPLERSGRGARARDRSDRHSLQLRRLRSPRNGPHHFRRRLGLLVGPQRQVDAPTHDSRLACQACWRRAGGRSSTSRLEASSVRGIPNAATSTAALEGRGDQPHRKSSSVRASSRKGVRCNAICPGTIESPSLDGRIEDELSKSSGQITLESVRQAFVDRQPMGRLGKPEEIAAIAVYLASDESAFATGQAFIVDGGFAL